MTKRQIYCCFLAGGVLVGIMAGLSLWLAEGTPVGGVVAFAGIVGGAWLGAWGFVPFAPKLTRMSRSVGARGGDRRRRPG